MAPATEDGGPCRVAATAPHLLAGGRSEVDLGGDLLQPLDRDREELVQRQAEALFDAGDFLEVTSGSGIAVGDLISVNTDALNIREGAGLSWSAIDVLTYGFQASVIDGPVTVDGYTWYKISTSAITGWVAGEFLVAI